MAFNKSIGVPESHDLYQLTIPEGDDKATFEVIANAVRPAALVAGVPASKLSGVWDKVVAAIDGHNKALEAKGAALQAADEAALKEKYGDKYDNFVAETDKVYGKTKTGPALKQILETFGLASHPAVKEHLYEMAPLVNQGATVVGDGTPGEEGGSWPTTYKYDPITGKPMG